MTDERNYDISNDLNSLSRACIITRRRTMTIKQDLAADIEFLNNKERELIAAMKILESYEGHSGDIDLSDFAGDSISLIEDYFSEEVVTLTRYFEEEPMDDE